MALDRFTFDDPYVLEELRRRYRDSDAKGRTRLLKQLYKSEWVPAYEIVLMAVEDPAVQVRQWIARNGKHLDYRKEKWVDDKTVFEFPERNLADRLKNDPDPYVRACLRENENVFSWTMNIMIGKWKRSFEEATHPERLALVRNPEIVDELIELIFDPDDRELNIDLESRRELVLAFLTNQRKLRESHVDYSDFYEGEDAYSTTQRFSKLWKLSSKWPIGPNVPYCVYRYMGAVDQTKAEIYGACGVTILRRAILENCDERDWLTLALGAKDADDRCREVAYRKMPGIDGASLDALLKGEDTHVLRGLVDNPSLPKDVLSKVQDRLIDLDPHYPDSFLPRYRTKEKTEKTQQRENDIDRIQERLRVLSTGLHDLRRYVSIILALLVALLVLMLF